MRTYKHVAVNKKCGSSRNSKLHAFAHVFFHFFCHSAGVEALIEFFCVQSQVFCISLKACSIKRLLIFKYFVMVFQKFALLISALASFCCFLRILMEA